MQLIVINHLPALVLIKTNVCVCVCVCMKWKVNSKNCLMFLKEISKADQKYSNNVKYYYNLKRLFPLV